MKNQNITQRRLVKWLGLTAITAVTAISTSVYYSQSSASHFPSGDSAASGKTVGPSGSVQNGGTPLDALTSTRGASTHASLSVGPTGSTNTGNGSSVAVGGGSTKAASSKGGVRSLFSVKETVSGEPLVAAGLNPDADKGRVVKLDSASAREWRNLSEGSVVALPTVSGDTLEGTVNLTQQESGWTRIGGELADGRGSFSLNTDGNEVSGMILLPDLGVGYKIQMDGADVLLVERRLSTLMCFPGAATNKAAAVSDGVARKAVAAAPTVPVINTRPGAKGVIFVDFDGESVTDPVWNSGRVINAAPSTLTSDQISQVIAISAQDYAPFDVTFTTDSAVYAATPVGRRMHVVVTPTDAAAPGAGGVAYVDSWSGAGKNFRLEVVCWVFNQSVKSVAESVSHEVGHTLGLNHDGQTGGIEYYAGNGGGLTTPTSWAPIMGVGYNRSLVQWSKGEYAQANNTEDDIAIISRSANQFGFIQAELPNGLKSLPVVNGTFQTVGMLRTADSADSYQFNTTGGQFTASAAPSAVNSDVDVKLELTDSTGATVVLSDVPDALSASVNRTLAAGTYRLTVRPAASGVKPAGGYVTGYSAYGSIGRYTLSGNLQGSAGIPPVFTSPAAISGTAGTPLSAKVEVSSATSVSVVSSVLPGGLTFDPTSLVLSGTPLVETGTGAAGTATGPGLLSLKATNATGSVSQDFVITINKGGLPLASAFPANAGTVSTTAAAPWTGVNLVRADGVTGVVAQSGPIANNGVTSLNFEYTLPASSSTSGQQASAVLTFYWKASTEPLANRNRSGDFVQCAVNGRLASDATTGEALYISGETNWIKQTVNLRGSGTQRVTFTYAKDGSISKGQDRVWVYATVIGKLPQFTTQPASVRLSSGSSAFTLTTVVNGADSLVWRRDFATLKDGTSSSGSTISGSTLQTLSVSNTSAADAGIYWLEAKNAFGSIISNPVEVTIAAPPVIIQQPVAPLGLKLGDTLTLSATVSGGTPLYYQWTKDGQNGRWQVASSSSVSLVVPKVTASAAGKYTLSVMNRFATVNSGSVTVSFGTVQGSPSR